MKCVSGQDRPDYLEQETFVYLCVRGAGGEWGPPGSTPGWERVEGQGRQGGYGDVRVGIEAGGESGSRWTKTFEGMKIHS